MLYVYYTYAHICVEYFRNVTSEIGKKHWFWEREIGEEGS